MTESPKPLGMSDFFALEAGEYLERLDGMLAKGDSPSADEIVRLARALRGSALMGNQPAIARAAAGLEVLARAVREGRRAWDPQTQQLALRAVDDLKIFVRRAGSWTDADTAKAEALAVELEQVAGRPSAQIRAVEALGLDAGARAFVAREGAAIAGALERAAQALRQSPGPRTTPARDARTPAAARPRRPHRPAAAPRPARGNRARPRRAIALETRAPDQPRRAVPGRGQRDRARRPRSGRARPTRPGRARFPAVRRVTDEVHGKRAGRRFDRLPLLQ